MRVFPLREQQSGRVGRSDPPGDLATLFPFDDTDVVLTLKIQPELGTIAEVTSQTYSRIRRNRATAVENIADASRRNADIEGQFACTEPARSQLPLQQSSRMNDGSHIQPHLTPPLSHPPRTRSDPGRIRAAGGSDPSPRPSPARERISSAAAAAH